MGSSSSRVSTAAPASSVRHHDVHQDHARSARLLEHASASYCGGSFHRGMASARRWFDATLFSAWNFAVIGVQKSGTTQVDHILQSHAEVCAVDRQLRIDANGSVTWGVNRSAWRCGSACATRRGGVDPEASLTLLLQPGLAARLWSTRVKLVLVLREPIQRAWSAFRTSFREHNFKHSTRYLNFAECVATEITDAEALAHSGYVASYGNATVFRGLYDRVLTKLIGAGFVPSLTAEPAGRLLVLISERLLDHERATDAALFNFLGIGWQTTPKRIVAKHSHGNYNFTARTRVVRRLYAFYRNSTRRTYQLLGAPIREWEAFYDSVRARPTTVQTP